MNANDVLISDVVFFKQKTAYEMRISDWSSDVCSSDLGGLHQNRFRMHEVGQSWRKPMLLYPLSTGMTAPVIHPALSEARNATSRSEERRVGKECVSTCRSRWAPYT